MAVKSTNIRTSKILPMNVDSLRSLFLENNNIYYEFSSQPSYNSTGQDIHLWYRDRYSKSKDGKTTLILTAITNLAWFQQR